MFHLVYASAAVGAISTRDLLAWLPLYREKNVGLGVTGLLLYKQGEYMQALEGEETVVRGLFAKIQKDQRHDHVHLLLALEVARRRFPQWSMGFRDLDEEPCGEVAGCSAHPNLPPRGESDGWKPSIAIGMLAAFMHD